ncbi:hypothetical protein OIA45_47880 (plasmid) [Streptomyces chartreusis]|uniref:hypothetical protein n=1 Tax=Streptomyces chartreusis TaxID=1969 RepID=UPI00386813DA|nr:hypothetical protein OIA45_47880 [Streptomyces chartreusis]
MRSLLTARGLHAFVTGDSVVTVEVPGSAPITVTAAVQGDGLRWSARVGETVVYDTPDADRPTADPADSPTADLADGSLAVRPDGPADEGTGVPASSHFAVTDMVWVTDAVAVTPPRRSGVPI